MRTYRSVLKMVLVLGLVAGITSPAAAFLGNNHNPWHKLCL